MSARQAALRNAATPERNVPLPRWWKGVPPEMWNEAQAKKEIVTLSDTDPPAGHLSSCVLGKGRIYSDLNMTNSKVRPALLRGR